MKPNRLLKLLCLLSFLLLVAPFYDHCNGKRMRQIESVPAEEVMFEEVSPTEIDTIDETQEISKTVDMVYHEDSFFINTYHWIDDSNSENAFEIAYIEISSLLELKMDDLHIDFSTVSASDFIKGFAFHFKNCCFIIIVTNTVFILVLSLLKKEIKIYKFTLINLWLLILAIISIVFFESFFEDIRQIKWGYYVFIFFQIVIAVVARKTFIQKPE